MTAPRHWLEDSELLRETGVDLFAERDLLTVHNVDELGRRAALRAAALQAGVGGVARLGTRPWGWAARCWGITAVAALCGVSFVLGQASTRPQPSVAQGVEPPAPREVPAPLPQVYAAQPTPRVTHAVAGAVSHAATGAPLPAALPQRAPQSSLTAQLRVFESARTALAAGNHKAALREAQAYLEEYPSGEMWPEAAVLMLRSQVVVDPQAAILSATAWLEDARLAQEQAALHALRARARAAWGDCVGAQRDLAKAGEPPAALPCIPADQPPPGAPGNPY